MSRLRGANEESATESPTVLVILDSDDSGDELTGFSSPHKRYAGGTGPATMMEPPSAKKKMKIDGETTTEEAPIDIDSISTNPMRTRTKVSSDTSSKFPVSSPSDTVPLAGHRKKYVKNTLPAGAEWRILQEIALGHPPITYREKIVHWVCREELSDVEDVNNFDDQFQKREKFYSRSSSGRRSTGKESPYPNYNYQHFRSVILENLKGTPVGSSQESVGTRKSSQLQPSCSKASTVHDESPAPTKPDSNNVTIYEKILCPSSESSTTKASPSIRLHWTDEESVFRCNRLNPDIDKYSQLIKVRIDYNKQIDLKAKINEIFKTPTVPIKYSSPPSEMVSAARTGRKSLDANSSNDTKSVDDQNAQEIVDRKIGNRRSTGGKSNDSRRSSMRRSSQRKSSERGSTGRRSSERFPEVNCFQQDEFCNYLGLGMNGKVYSPTPTDNKRRSLRVKRLLVQTEAMDKKNDKKKELKKKKLVHSMEDDEQKDGDKSKEEQGRAEEVTMTNNLNEQNRCSLPSSTFIEKLTGSSSPAPEEDESPISPNPLTPNTTNIACKTPEIKIITRLRNTATPPTKSGNTPSSVTTVNSNSTPPPTTRRQRRTRATSNGTSTCPRSSQSDDESPEKSAVPSRRRRLNHHHHPSHLHHHHTHHPNDNDGSDLSESLQSDPAPAAADSGGNGGGGSGGSPRHNGRTSTIPASSEVGKKDELNKREVKDQEKDESAEWMHKKYQRYLEESRKTKPSIFIVESINNSEFKSSSVSVAAFASASAALSCAINNQKQNQNHNTPVIPKEHLSKESKSHKAKKWPKTRKRVLRRLLRRNGTVVGTYNQRILRNRIVFKSSRSNISKHQKVKVMKKEEIRMHLENEKEEEAKREEEETTEVESEKEMKRKKTTTTTKTKTTKKKNKEIEEENKASQIDFEINNSSTDVQSAFSPIDPLALTPPPPQMTPHEEEEDEDREDAERAKSFEMCDVEIQTEPYSPPPSLPPITFLTEPSNRMPNPLTPENGRVIYAFYELDILTIVQDFMVTFWKTFKLIQVVGNTTEEWVHLGECKRLLFDNEINAPYKNRICVHNSIPIYMEMRAKELPKLNRDCCLISVYVNVYYYHDEELIAKSHSIQLDTVASLPQNVVYTTITDSRYFVMCWSQETMIGKTLSGLCKYSLTPHLDTLASIREFKSMRHEIRYLECTTDDNLIGFGDSQVTLWDHRSGDILMNYDLDMEIGNNLGSLHFPPLEVGHAKTVLIFQKTSAEELSIIAINVSHNSPSHQLVCKHILPPEFDNLKSTIGIDDYTILTNSEHQELWIDHSDPQYMVQIKTPEGQRRFYSRCKQNVIVITENHLALETFSSFVLKMSNFSTGM
ncbi:uncharacterized protein LOC129939231 [Eupeodes corollae]|uniref:uncharacterized protein LOC129939231 n=1 Tax=Eupeodes corollae TaxID=290404 RepID=UPI002491489A|nr:uncharacterized protein LOC129939231 [Eupeodes corollae]